MQFAIAVPWWALALVAATLLILSWGSYAWASAAVLARPRRWTLIALRWVTLAILVACLLRPSIVLPADDGTRPVVPVLVDVSRSMRIADAAGQRRIEAAGDLVETLQAALAGRLRADVWTFGATAAPIGPQAALEADAGSSDVSGAVRAVLDRYRDRHVAGVVIISDGGDTGQRGGDAVGDDSPVPIYAIGVGASSSADREVVGVSAGDAALAGSSVDLTVTAVDRGTRGPFDVRLLENGRVLDVRRVTPAPDGGPVRATFLVAPAGDTATRYTAEISPAPGEAVLENNSRSLLVEPPGRPRLVLMIEGAPGFEHAFVTRALAQDPGLHIDSVVQKGRDADGKPTYSVQAAAERAAHLATGFPDSRAALFQYDALMLANVRADSVTREQSALVADFVAERGGGLLTFGARSFVDPGFGGTPIEAVLPLDLGDRGRGVMRAVGDGREPFSVAVTDSGEAHPVMRLGVEEGGTTVRWAAVPPLAGAAMLGPPQPGAQVLATVAAADGPRPLVAVQRFGRGRAMLFTGEGSWRWRMRLPSSDRTHELFWRQAVRWTAAASPDRVSLIVPAAAGSGTRSTIGVEVRDDEFRSVPDAQVMLRVTGPGGEATEHRALVSDAGTGRYDGEVPFERPGVYRVTAEVRRGTTLLGAVERAVLVDGADREMADPRLNAEVLQRLARASGGRYVTAAEAGRIAALLTAVTPPSAPAPPRLREMWSSPWVFAVVVGLLTAEWFLRRRWGLR